MAEFISNFINYLIFLFERLDWLSVVDILLVTVIFFVILLVLRDTQAIVLLRGGLVNEVNVVISPELVGGTTPKSMFVAPDLTSTEGVILLRLLHLEHMKGDFIWLRYAVQTEPIERLAD